MSETPKKVPLWLDCDTGHDDAYAILLAAHDPNIKLLGVSTVHGNAPLDRTTFNSLAILEAIGRRDVKVYPGAAKPLERDAVHAADIHGESGLDGVTLLPQPIASAVTDMNFLDAMYQSLITTAPNTAWLVATGTLTNIALLFQKHADLAVHLQGLSIMGGAVGGGFTNAPMGKANGEGERFGNWTAYAEFNCDPEASSFLLTHPVLRAKLTLVPLDLTHLVLATPAVRLSQLYGPNRALHPVATLPSPVRALFSQIISFFADTYASVFAITAGPPLHDPLAVAAAVYPDMLDDNGGERFEVHVVTEGVHASHQGNVGELGRTKVQKVTEGKVGCRIPRSVDLKRFWSLVEGALGRAEGCGSMRQLRWEELEMEGVSRGLE